MKGPDDIRDRVERIEEELGYGDASLEELYLLALKDASEHAPDYPGAGSAYLRAFRERAADEERKRRRRAEQFSDSGDESESAGGEP